MLDQFCFSLALRLRWSHSDRKGNGRRTPGSTKSIPDPGKGRTCRSGSGRCSCSFCYETAR